MEATPLLKLFAITHGALHMNLEGLTHEDSLVAPGGGGNCLNWVVGHIVASRDMFLPMIGGEPVLPPGIGERYRRGSEPIRDGAGARPLAELVAAFDGSQERMLAAIRALGPGKLAAPIEIRSLPGSPATVFEAIAVLNFHEAYHVGQVGLLRRVAGRAGAIR